MVAMVGGHVEASSSAIGEVAEFVKAGKARILGIPSKKRFPMFPDVPTYKEQGYDVEMGAFIGLVTPKGTAQEIIKVLEEACAKGVESEEYKRIQEDFGNRVQYLNSRDFAQFVRVEDAQYHKIVKQLNLEKPK